jgi:hypothetical protein
MRISSLVIGLIDFATAVAFPGKSDLQTKSAFKASTPTPLESPPQTSPYLREDRARIDAYFEAHAARPLGECKDDLLELVGAVARACYQEGGREMEAGISRNNPHMRWG